MKAQLPILIPLLSALFASNVAAVTRYVDLNSASPAPPYIDWGSAATSIQDAIDVAQTGDQILVTNGIYQLGGRAINGLLTNRVAVTKPVSLQSVNGASVTVIQGYQVPGTINGDSAVRCIYLTNGAALIGFTLFNGATRNSGSTEHDTSGGGLWCESTNVVVSNCVLVANSAAVWGAGTYAGTLNDCVISNNWNLNGSPAGGGGAYLSVLNNCVIIANRANNASGVHTATLNSCLVVSNSSLGARNSILNNCTLTGNLGGGAASSTLDNCVVSSNSLTGASTSTLRNCLIIGNSGTQGGGVSSSTLSNCLVKNNRALSGGGAQGSTLINCTVLGNSANNGGGVYGLGGPALLTNCVVSGNRSTNHGGGAYAATLNNCLVTSNSATIFGGGGYNTTLNNCTVVANSAADQGGGTHSGTSRNSILYYNSAPSGSNVASGTISYCCTPGTFIPPGSFTNAPRFIDQAGGNFRLQTNSPCINTGNNAQSVGQSDIDGRPRNVGGTVDVGAYEHQSSGMGEFIGWLQHYSLSTDGSTDFTDNDSDGMNNWGEWRSDTIPTNALSVLRMLSVINGSGGLNVTWQSVPTRTYFVHRVNDLRNPFQLIATNIAGVAGVKTYTDTTATNDAPYFYRVGVH